MKKLLLIVCLGFIIGACNNSADSEERIKDSLDSVAEAAKEVIDSAAEERKEAIDSSIEQKKENIDTLIQERR